VKAVNISPWTTTSITAQLPGMPQHLSAYGNANGKPVFVRVIGVLLPQSEECLH